MSVIDRAAKQAGLTLDRDVPVQGQRRCRDWAKLIGAARKLESQDAEFERESHRRIERLAEEKAELAVVVHRLERENEQLKLRERMRQMELSEKDQRLLIEGPSEEAA